MQNEKLNKDYKPLDNTDDWDILIILDACRFDIFKKTNTIPGKLEMRISYSTDTGEWRDDHFDKDYSNIVYISGNPLIRTKAFENNEKKVPYFHLEPVWFYGWDEKLKTIPPDIVTIKALELNQKYPNKKMVVHYMQPHHPFIGEYSLEEDGYLGVIRTAQEKTAPDSWETVYQKQKDGIYSYKQMVRAYTDNLKLVLGKLKPLLKLNKKVIITADHGDCFGEGGIRAHPRATYVPLLTNVPWFTCDKQTTDSKKDQE